MKNIIIIIICLISFSCNDYLDVDSKSQVSDNTLWDNIDNADLFLSNIYSGLPGPFNTFDPKENLTDNAMNGVNGTYSRTLYASSTYTADNVQNQWSHLYANIRKANLFIERVTENDFPEDWKKQRIGEAKFLRAYFYMRQNMEEQVGVLL